MVCQNGVPEVSRMAIAFVQNQKSARWAIQEALKASSNHLVLVSEDELLSIHDLNNLRIERKRLAEFRPPDLDLRVLNEIERYYSEWLNNNQKLSVFLKNTGIDYAIYASYAAIIFQLFRRIVLLDCILKTLNPSIVIIDNHWRRYYVTKGSKKKDVILISGNDNHKRGISGRGLRITIFAVGAAIGGITAPILLGKIINRLIRTKIKACSCLLIGDYFPNKSFAPVWEAIQADGEETDELSLGTISISGVKTRIKEGSRWTEGYCSLLAGVGLFFTYFRIAWYYLTARNRSFPLPNYPLYSDLSISFSSDYKTDLDWFFLKSLSRAICVMGLGMTLKEKLKMKSVVFTRLSPATRSLSHQLRQIGITTISTVHGMVLEPIAYKTRDTIKLTWGGFDSDVLKAFSDDDKYIGLPVNPDGYKNVTANHEEYPFKSQDEIKRCFPSSFGDTLNFCDLRGKCAVVFPSTNQHGASLSRFLSISVTHLLNSRDKYGFDYIVVKPKKHPRTKYDEFYAVLSETVPEDCPVPVVFSDTININSLLRCSSFSLCAHSSIMLDCLRMNVPFSVYLNDSLSDRSFMSEFPAWMIYSSEDDLRSIGIVDLTKFSQTANMLRMIYWGSDENQFQTRKKRFYF